MIFSKNADTRALAIKSVEGEALAGTIFIRPLITGEEMSLLEFSSRPVSRHHRMHTITNP